MLKSILLLVSRSVVALAPVHASAQEQCQISETSPRRTIVNGYVRYVGEEVGAPGSVTRFGDLAIRVTESGMTDEAELFNEAKRLRGSSDRITKQIKFDIKAPGMIMPVLHEQVEFYPGRDSSTVNKTLMCGQEVSISVLERDGLDYWVISTF